MNGTTLGKVLRNAGVTYIVLRRAKNASVLLQGAGIIYTSLVCGLRIGARLRSLSARD
jgi:hypothetical protein